MVVYSPAAFRRLCVETQTMQNLSQMLDPAAFRRLCVETFLENGFECKEFQPPSGGCVLKLGSNLFSCGIFLPAAFRRLCVETFRKGLKKQI